MKNARDAGLYQLERVFLEGDSRDWRSFAVSTVLCGMLILFMAAPYGALWAEPTQLRGGGFEESIRESIDVSGVYLIAVIQGDELRSPSLGKRSGENLGENLGEMFVWLPESSGSYLCVAVRSIDGVYLAEDRFPIAGRAAGVYALVFETQSTKVVLEYGAGELALDGRIGDDCERKDQLEHVPMAWASDVSTQHFVLLINDGGHDGFVVIPDREGTGELRETPCRRLPLRQSHRIFSAACTLRGVSRQDLVSGWLELRRYGDVTDREGLAVSIPETYGALRRTGPAVEASPDDGS